MFDTDQQPTTVKMAVVFVTVQYTVRYCIMSSDIHPQRTTTGHRAQGTGENGTFSCFRRRMESPSKPGVITRQLQSEARCCPSRSFLPLLFSNSALPLEPLWSVLSICGSKRRGSSSLLVLPYSTHAPESRHASSSDGVQTSRRRQSSG